MPESTEVKPKKSRVRSPNFPVISLEKAVERTKKLYDRDKQHGVPIGLIHDRWGYKKMSGILQQTVGALRAYGLVNVTGSGDKRIVTISDEGRKVVMNHTDREAILRKMAVAPTVFGHLESKYRESGLPSDDVLREYLLFDYESPFNEDGVDTAIERFKETMEFAFGTYSDIISHGGEEDEADQRDNTNNEDEKPKHQGQQHNPLRQKAGMKTLTFALVEGDVTIQVPHPITQASFTTLLGILELQKCALVQEPLAQSDKKDNGPEQK